MALDSGEANHATLRMGILRDHCEAEPVMRPHAFCGNLMPVEGFGRLESLAMQSGGENVMTSVSNTTHMRWVD